MTDSTASLPAGAAERWGVEVVPLEVGLGDARYQEGVDLDPAELLAALGAGTPVTTSQPPPARFAAAYARAVQRGAREVVSVHVSGELSGTVRAAELAAATAAVPVHVVDSRTVAMALGFAVLAAAERAAGEGSAESAAGRTAQAVSAAGRRVAGAETAAGDGAAVAQRARAVAASSSVLFLLEGLDHLRRGGRIGTTAAAVGGLLGTRPLLTTRDGRVEGAGAVRTRRAGRERLIAMAVDEAAARPGARIAVHHLGRPEAGEELADAVRARLAVAAGAATPHGSADEPGGPAPTRQEIVVTDVSAVVGAHAGPGLLGVVVADR